MSTAAVTIASATSPAAISLAGPPLRLSISLALMCLLSTTLLGMGQRDATLPLLAVVVAAASLYLTDYRGWLRLSPRAADVVGVSVYVYALWDFRSMRSDEQLLAMASLLVYMQFVLQFQYKSERTYWLLALLSILQAAVSTALNLQLAFGLLLVAYLFVALGAMTAFFLYREAVDEWPAPPHRRRSVLDFLGPRQPARQRTRAASPIFRERGMTNVAGEIAGRPFAHQILMLSLGTLVLTMVVFVLIPRTPRTPWQQQETGAGLQRTGLSDNVKLGDFGALVEDPASVMRVQFFDYETGEPYTIRSELLFRGMLLTHYDDGAWAQPSAEPDPRRLAPYHAPLGGELVEQHIAIEPLDTEVVCSIYPFRKNQANSQLWYDFANHHLLRVGDAQRTTFSYKLVTTGLRNGRQLPLTPAAGRPSAAASRLPGGRSGEKLSRLRELAVEIVDGIPVEDAYTRAAELEKYMQSVERFSYSLETDEHPVGVDPTEYFLLESRRGHCQYFASALTLMLRSVGIPARMVVGYRGGEWNPIGEFFHVRQLHAHAWVEAYLRPEQIPDDLPMVRRDVGAWYRLDPTPGAGQGGLEDETSSGFPSIQQFVDYLQFIWGHYVVGMDARRQQDGVYMPVVRATTEVASVVGDPQVWIELGRYLLGVVRPSRWHPAGDRWFHWRGALVGMLLAAVVFLSVKLGSRWSSRWRAWRAQRKALRRQLRDPRYAFYRRMEKLLARHRLRRAEAQTQREFADLVARRLAQSGATRDFAHVPHRVATAFYRVRFGDERLDTTELQALESGLVQLEQALATVKNGS